MTQDRYMRLRGDGVNVNRYRANKENTHVHLYLDVRGEHTLADLLAVAEEQQVSPEDVTFRGGIFCFELPATADDVAEWERGDAERAAHDRKRRYEWYLRAKAEFEPDEPTPLTPGAPVDMRHNGHEFVAGISEDDPDNPSPAWCHICGEARVIAPGSDQP